MVVIGATFTYLFSIKFSRNLSMRGTARLAYLNLPPIDTCALPVKEVKGCLRYFRI